MNSFYTEECSIIRLICEFKVKCNCDFMNSLSELVILEELGLVPKFEKGNVRYFML